MTNKHDIIWLDTVDSTNEAARRQISEIDNLSVLSALEQTSGKGQRGNRWSSRRGQNLMFSIVLKFSDSDATGSLPYLPARDQFLLTEIASLSVVDLLSKYGISAKIKWPNDIYVGDMKICGILIENSLRGQALSSSIIGIGLNVNQKNFDVDIPNPTSMTLSALDSAAFSGPFDLHECLEGFMDIFASYHYRCLSKGSDTSPLRLLYLDRLWRVDQPSRFIDYTTLPSGHLDGPMNLCTAGGSSLATGAVSTSDVPSSTDQSDTITDTCREFLGIIRGLSPIGNLLVEDLTSGELREFGFKEIGYLL